MDCNSYSYAPTMLDGKQIYLDRYEDDDVIMELEQSAENCFSVWMFDYAGGTDIFEEFPTREGAKNFYDSIRKKYSRGREAA